MSKAPKVCECSITHSSNHIACIVAHKLRALCHEVFLNSEAYFPFVLQCAHQCELLVLAVHITLQSPSQIHHQSSEQLKLNKQVVLTLLLHISVVKLMCLAPPINFNTSFFMPVLFLVQLYL